MSISVKNLGIYHVYQQKKLHNVMHSLADVCLHEEQDVH